MAGYLSAEDNDIPKEYVLICNKDSTLVSLTRLELYKLFNNSNNDTYRLFCHYIKDSDKSSDQYKQLESYLRFALDDSNITLIKYKSLALDKIRKRDTVRITTFKNNIVDIISEVKNNVKCIGLIPSTYLTDEVKQCSISL